MGKAARSTILELDLSPRARGGANTEKRAALEKTTAILTEARAFFLDFLLAHHEKLTEKVVYFSEKQELRERLLTAEELRSWLEQCTVSTKAHPSVPPEWDFKARFPGMPTHARRATMKEAIGKARGYLTARSTWQKSGKKKGKPGLPGAADHPTFYQGAFELELEDAKIHDRFVRLKVYDGTKWDWMNYPVKCSRHFEGRMKEKDWKRQSPTLVLRGRGAALHFPQAKEVQAARVLERKLEPHLVTVGVDLNVKNLAVVTVRRDEQILETVFIRDHGLDQARYRHLKKIATKQWQTGKPIKGELGVARQKALQTRLAWLKVRGESPVRGTPRQRLTGQARRVRSPANAAGLSLIPTGHAPTHMLCWDVPESIPAWNVAGTLSLADCLRAVRTLVVRDWVPFWAAGDAAYRSAE
jgi:hypothetical protein